MGMGEGASVFGGALLLYFQQLIWDFNLSVDVQLGMRGQGKLSGGCIGYTLANRQC